MVAWFGRVVQERERDTYFFFVFTLVTGPGRSVSLKLSDTRVHEPQIRAHPVTTAHFDEAAPKGCLVQESDLGEPRVCIGRHGSAVFYTGTEWSERVRNGLLTHADQC